MSAQEEQLRRALADVSGLAPDSLLRLLSAAFDAGLFEEMDRAVSARFGEDCHDPRVLQMQGLARRGMQDSGSAHAAFRRAAEAAPADPLIAHSLARTAMEAGYPASAHFARARALAPRDGSVILGHAAAQLAEGDGLAACATLELVLADNPHWFEGHRALARTTAMIDPTGDTGASLRRAIAKAPADTALWQALVVTYVEADDYRAALDAVKQARAAIGNPLLFQQVEASCLSELGECMAAQAIFDRQPIPGDGATALWPLRNLIRLGRIDDARTLAGLDFPEPGLQAIWPYRALIWRMLDDPRWEWLEGDERLIGRYDIAAEVGSMDDLAELLRSLHRGTGQPLGQSLRGGTQTDGMLLARAEPEIRRLRAALEDVMRAHVAQLPECDPAHPTLNCRRSPIRFAGAWSVRLTQSGFHVDHVHLQGWLSSAFYVALPEIGDEAGQEGWLTFGENLRIAPDFPAFRTIRPQVGTLAVFPSTMWHGTRPFGEGERMTVAMDIARNPL